MGLYDWKQAMPDVPGISRLLMSYEPGTDWQLFKIDNVVARVRPMASNAEIRAALLAAQAETHA